MVDSTDFHNPIGCKMYAETTIRRALIFAAVLARVTCAQTPSPEFRQTVQPFLAKNCLTCHSERAHTAGLSPEQYRDAPALWAKVAEEIASGRMPPAGAPQPSKTDVTAVLGILDKPSGDSGRVTAHRLGVSLHPADQFPLDDAGYGFDNIGDVLSVSPLLMEKYVAAAKVVSRAMGNLFVAMLDRMGVPVESLGDSNGVLSDL